MSHTKEVFLMRKRTYLAITVLTGAIIAATPIQALAAGPQRAKTAKSNIKVVTGVTRI